MHYFHGNGKKWGNLKHVLDGFEKHMSDMSALRRKPLSSVDPIAQEHAVQFACSDAGIKPSELAVVELHGTGTPLGDPVEVSALARTGWATPASVYSCLFSVYGI